MKQILYRTLLPLLLAMPLLLSACHDSYEAQPSTPMSNFESLWKLMDERYCFFPYKSDIVDWDEVHSRYRDSITPNLKDDELFTLFANMLAEVQDGHVNLYTPFDVARYWKWYESHPQNYDARQVQEYYLRFDYSIAAGISYTAIRPTKDSLVGYMHYASFSSTIGNLGLDYILYRLSECDGLIIDLRDNGGGSLTNVETLASRFIEKELLSGYIQHKTGTGHNDLSALHPTYIAPSESTIKWLDKPVILLTNRSCYSATNNFVSIMRALPNVVQVGDTTGGGSGLPFSGELPNGWSVRFSASPVYDYQKQHTEFGLAPHYRVDVDDAVENPIVPKHTDAILEKAFQIVQFHTEKGVFPPVEQKK